MFVRFRLGQLQREDGRESGSSHKITQLETLCTIHARIEKELTQFGEKFAQSYERTEKAFIDDCEQRIHKLNEEIERLRRLTSESEVLELVKGRKLELLAQKQFLLKEITKVTAQSETTRRTLKVLQEQARELDSNIAIHADLLRQKQEENEQLKRRLSACRQKGQVFMTETSPVRFRPRNAARCRVPCRLRSNSCSAVRTPSIVRLEQLGEKLRPDGMVKEFEEAVAGGQDLSAEALYRFIERESVRKVVFNLINRVKQ